MRLRNSICALIAAALLNNFGIAYAEKVLEKKMNDHKSQTQQTAITDEMVIAWTGFLSEIEKILAGEKLISFWRGGGGQGINLFRVFLEPRTFDLVLWIQGTAAAPYLETGDTTKIATWNSLQNAFGRHFPGFAIWFN